jgi:hypothetical protein
LTQHVVEGIILDIEAFRDAQRQLAKDARERVDEQTIDGVRVVV